MATIEAVGNELKFYRLVGYFYSNTEQRKESTEKSFGASPAVLQKHVYQSNHLESTQRSQKSNMVR